MISIFQRLMTPKSRSSGLRGGIVGREQSKRRLQLESLETRNLLASLPYGAGADDLGEFMLGDVYVTVVFMESNETVIAVNPTDNGLEPDSEDWTAQSIAETKQRITEGLQWWEDTLATITDKHELNFQIDFTYADTPVATAYEPIANYSDKYQDWGYDFLRTRGYNSGTSTINADVRDFNHRQRIANDADWAFTMFVLNDENDEDGRFRTGGSFTRAFAFAGGQFLVAPASRPASTFAHETGHIFWAMDEYSGGASYGKRRGYYDTQNLNGRRDNPDPDFIQADSIMSSGNNPGDPLYEAYANHVSPASTLAMIGWQDSDGDGVFDVLDVPHQLTGNGYYDVSSERYRFVGNSKVQTLPNLNSSGYGNDITINEISRVEYRIDGGDWTTALSPGVYEIDLDLSIPVPAGSQSIDIRSVDSVTGVTSSVFTANFDGHVTATPSGAAGLVYYDNNTNGTWDVGEQGLSNVAVQLVDAGGSTIDLTQSVNANDFAIGTNLTNAIPGVTLTAVGDNSVVTAVTSEHPTVTAHVIGISPDTVEWNVGRVLRIDFDQPVSQIQLDVIAVLAGVKGDLRAYSADGAVVAHHETDGLSTGQKETISIVRDSYLTSPRC